jgi:hypothetical protein
MCACIIIGLDITTKRRERPGGSETQNIGASRLYLVTRVFREANVSCTSQKNTKVNEGSDTEI